MSKSYLQNTPPAIGKGFRGAKDGRIGYLLRQANLAHEIRANKILIKFGLTLPQYSVLSILELYPGASNAELARACLLTPQTIFVIIKNLTKMELISRSPHETHGRIQHLYLTTKGEKLINEATQDILSFQKELVHGLNTEEEQIIRRWLVNIAQNS